MSERQLRDEVMTLLLAGHDTTSNTLTWSWYLLTQNPGAFAKVRAEARSVLGQRVPTLADLPRLAYTRAVVKEAMRLYPPVYAFGREAVHDCSVGRCFVRRGTNILLCQWLTQRDERFYDAPLEFRPERWTDHFERDLPPYAYFPFGGGPRVCIGKEFALAEAACVLSTLAARFDVQLEPGQNVQPWPTVTLRPREAICATVTPQPE
jgi:cytochrome P450